MLAVSEVFFNQLILKQAIHAVPPLPRALVLDAQISYFRKHIAQYVPILSGDTEY